MFRPEGKLAKAGILTIVLAWCLIGAALAWNLTGISGCTKNNKPNVLLMTLDTTRADHIRCYGHDWIETPALNSLAREGVLFERAYSHIPLTLPAHTSIFSGTPPLYHGVIDNGGYRVPDDLVTMAELLKDQGYQTSAFISAAVLQSPFNLNQGFDHWDEEGIEEQSQGGALVADRPGNETTDAAIEWLKNREDGPFFTWVHYYDPHAQYNPPEPYDMLYATMPYDGEIAFMDSQIEKLMSWLKENGLYENTIILAIGDHGESLGEHEEQTHAVFIYDATQHIPFIARFPAMEKRDIKVSAVVSHMDILPTVLEYLGLEIPDQVIGKSAMPLVRGEDVITSDRSAFLESSWPLLHYNWSPLHAIVSGEYKYIQAPKPELYNLKNDPGEVNNLYEDGSKVAAQLESRLNSLKNEWSEMRLESAEAEVSPQLKEKLIALGYVQGGHAAKEELSKGKDPKDYTAILPALSRIQNAMALAEYKMVLELARETLALDPENPKALSMKAEALFGIGRNEESIEAFHDYFKIHDEIPFSGYNSIGMIHIRLAAVARAEEDHEKAIEEYKEAIANFEKSLEQKENNLFANYYMGRVYVELGEYEKAKEYFIKEGLADTELGHTGMGIYYDRTGRVGLAEAEFQRADDLSGEKSVIFWQEYAQFLMRQGEHQQMVELLEKALEEDPSLKHEPMLMQALEQYGSTIEPGGAPGVEMEGHEGHDHGE